MGRGKDWTTQEVMRAIELRGKNYTIQEIASILTKEFGLRTETAVRQQLHRCDIRIYQKYSKEDKIRSIIRKLVKQGKCDNRIALMIKRTPRTVRYYRSLLKLKANRASTIKRRYAFCFGCGVRAPITICNGWVKLCNWHIRDISENDMVIQECHCDKCYTKYGWGDQLTKSLSEKGA